MRLKIMGAKLSIFSAIKMYSEDMLPNSLRLNRKIGHGSIEKRVALAAGSEDAD